MGKVLEKRDGPLIGNNVRVELVLVKFLNLTHCLTLTAIHKFSEVDAKQSIKSWYCSLARHWKPWFTRGTEGRMKNVGL